MNLPSELRFRLHNNPTNIVEEVAQILMIQKVKMLSIEHNGLNPWLLSLIWGVGGGVGVRVCTLFL